MELVKIAKVITANNKFSENNLRELKVILNIQFLVLNKFY